VEQVEGGRAKQHVPTDYSIYYLKEHLLFFMNPKEEGRVFRTNGGIRKREDGYRSCCKPASSHEGPYECAA